MPLIVVYPFMKRITYWPQAFLGITFNWGVLVGYAAVTGALELPALLLYAAGFFWTLGYDTLYAHQDKEDDALIGVKSTALLLGAATPRWLLVFYGATLALLLAGRRCSPARASCSTWRWCRSPGCCCGRRAGCAWTSRPTAWPASAPTAMSGSPCSRHSSSAPWADGRAHGSLTDYLNPVRVLGDVWDELGILKDRALDRHLRVAVTGLSRSGKTVFITSLVHHLLDGHGLPFLQAVHDGRYLGARLDRRASRRTSSPTPASTPISSPSRRAGRRRPTG